MVAESLIGADLVAETFASLGFPFSLRLLMAADLIQAVRWGIRRLPKWCAGLQACFPLPYLDPVPAPCPVMPAIW